MKKLIALFVSLASFAVFAVPELATTSECTLYFQEAPNGALCFVYDGSLQEVMEYFPSEYPGLENFVMYEANDGFYFYVEDYQYSVYQREGTKILIVMIPIGG